MWHVQVKKRNTNKALFGKSERKDFLEDQIVDGNAPLNCILRKQEERA